MSGSTKPLDQKTKERYAELIGLGLTHPEAAGATGISERSGQRLMAEPAYRKIAGDLKRKRTSMSAEAASVVRDLLRAVNHDGTPDLDKRRQGAEMAAKYSDALDSGDADLEDEMLPGVVKHTILVFPNPNIPDPNAPVVFTEADLAPIPEE